MSQEATLAQLSEQKKAQLLSCNCVPPIYAVIEKYEFDPEVDATIYHLEVGLEYGGKIVTKTLLKRYSEIRLFDGEIRKDFAYSKYVEDFPPKALFGNKNPEFLKERTAGLQRWLDSLVKVPGISTSPTVTRFFGIGPSDTDF